MGQAKSYVVLVPLSERRLIPKALHFRGSRILFFSRALKDTLG